MKTILIIVLLCVYASAETKIDLKDLHAAALEAEVLRLSDLVSLLSAQIKAMHSEQKANEAKAAEKAAIEAEKKSETAK